MEDVSIHDFHCLLARDMKEKLRNLKVFKGTRGISGIIVRILQLLTPVIGQEYKWGDQRCAKYMNVCDDPDVVRDHVHVYVPDSMYRELKLLHQGLNFYSIAQFVRGLLEWFLNFVEGCEGDALKELREVFGNRAAEKKESRLTIREYMRQLLKIIRHLPGKNRLITIYNQDYSPFRVMRI
jgi:hypothetical protein